MISGAPKSVDLLDQDFQDLHDSESDSENEKSMSKLVEVEKEEIDNIENATNPELEVINTIIKDHKSTVEAELVSTSKEQNEIINVLERTTARVKGHRTSPTQVEFNSDNPPSDNLDNLNRLVEEQMMTTTLPLPPTPNETDITPPPTDLSLFDKSFEICEIEIEESFVGTEIENEEFEIKSELNNSFGSQSLTKPPTISYTEPEVISMTPANEPEVNSMAQDNEQKVIPMIPEVISMIPATEPQVSSVAQDNEPEVISMTRDNDQEDISLATDTEPEIVSTVPATDPKVTNIGQILVESGKYLKFESKSLDEILQKSKNEINGKPLTKLYNSIEELWKK